MIYTTYRLTINYKQQNVVSTKYL